MKKPGSLLAPIAAVVIVAASLVWPALAQEPTSPPAPEPKKEDAPPAAPAPVAEPAATPSAQATPSDPASLSFHGEARYRYEFWKNPTDFTNTIENGAGDDTYDVAPWRVRLSAMADLGHGITTMADLQGTGQWGSAAETRSFFGSDPNDGTDVDLYQGWVNFSDIGSPSLDLKVGRQEIDFDRGLHFSSEPYYNGRSHDGVMATWDAENRAIHAFWTRAVESDDPFGAPVHDDDDLLGAHVRHALGKEDASDLAYYAFYKIGRGNPMASGHSTIYTVGVRHGRERKEGSGWIWNLEGAYQGGETALSSSKTLDRDASVYEGMIGYASDKSGSARSYWVGVYKASGDGDPSDNVVNSFEPLYPELHDRLGDSDVIPLTNVRAIHAGLKTAFRENHTFRGEFYQFAKVKEKDVIVSPLSGITLSSSCATSTARCSVDLGREFDLAYGYQMGEGVTLGITLAYVAPGNAIKDTVGVPSITNSGAQAAYRLAFGARARF